MTDTTPRQVFRLTWPILIEQFLFLLMGSADTFMLSHISSTAVAAVGASNQVVSIVLMIFNMVAGASSVWVAQYRGAEQLPECAAYSAGAITVNLWVGLVIYISVFGMSLAIGTQIVVGHVVGSGKFYEAYRQVWRTLGMAFSIALGVSLIIAASSHSLFRLFTSDPAVIQMGTHLLLICILLEPGRTFNLVMVQCLRAAGDVQYPVILGIIFPFLLGIPFSYYLGVHLHMELIGVWWTICLDEWTRGVLNILRWKSRRWEKKVLVKPTEAVQA